MRATILAAALLIVLGLGVVESRRSSDGEGGWLSAALDAGRAATSTQPPAPADPRAASPPPAAAEPAPAPAVLTAGELSVVGEPEPEPMLRYVDDEGSVHMVRGLDRVPAAYRADAVALGRGHVNVLSMPAPTAAAFRDWQPAANPNRRDVVLFSAEWCGACQRAKQHLDRKGVAYRERDIDDDEDALREVQRVQGRVAIPLLGVDGRFIAGFRPDVYDRALGGA
jgi:glutaredoxin